MIPYDIKGAVHRALRPIAIATAFSVGLILLTECTGPASAQRRPSDALLLARICVSEAGWSCSETGDLEAIHEVLAWGAERQSISWRAYAQAYSPRATGRVATTGRLAWVAGLSESGARPSAWPPGASWTQYASRWAAVREASARVVTRSYADARAASACGEPVHDWGGPRVDRERAARLGLVRVDCGETANDFYARPSQRGHNAD